MAGQQISITSKATTITSDGPQPGTEALDVLGMSGIRFDLVLRCYFVGGGSTPTLTITLETSMTNNDDDNWVALSSFQAVSTLSPIKSLSVENGVLRYIRWRGDVTGDTPVFVFDITGVAW